MFNYYYTTVVFRSGSILAPVATMHIIHIYLSIYLYLRLQREREEKEKEKEKEKINGHDGALHSTYTVLIDV